MTRGLGPVTVGILIQTTTPGTPQAGNGAITGTFIAQTGLYSAGGIATAQLSTSGTAPLVFGVANTFNRFGAPVGQMDGLCGVAQGGVFSCNTNPATQVCTGVFLGHGVVLNGTDNAVVLGNGAFANNPAATFEPGCKIAMGRNAGVTGPTAGAGLGSTGIAIGDTARIGVTAGGAFGPAGIVAGNHSSAVLQTAAQNKGVVVLGDNLIVGSVTPVDNVIVIANATPASPILVDTSNTLVIGDPSITNIQLGGLGNFGGFVYRKKAATVVNNSGAETSLFDGTLYSFPANGLSQFQYIRVHAEGFFNIGAVAETPMFKLKLGARVKTLTLTTTLVNTAGNVNFVFDGTFEIQTLGAAGTCNSNASLLLQQTAATAVPLIGTTRGNNDPLDTTVANAVDLTHTFSVADANATITCTQGWVQTW